MLTFFQAEDGIRDVERSRGLGDVYKRQQASVKVTGVTIMNSGNRATTGLAQRLDLAGCRRYKVIDSKDNVALCVLIFTQN